MVLDVFAGDRLEGVEADMQRNHVELHAGTAQVNEQFRREVQPGGRRRRCPLGD